MKELNKKIIILTNDFIASSEFLGMCYLKETGTSILWLQGIHLE